MMNTSKSKTALIISWTAYPTVIVSGLTLNSFLLDLGYPLQVSAYIPIILGIVITVVPFLIVLLMVVATLPYGFDMR